MKAPKLTPAQKLIIKMLKENTGRHMLDSGGAYGRNFERNEKLNFLDTPKFIENHYSNSINVSFNVFWYLSDHLTVTPESKKLNTKFKRYMKKNEDMYAPELMETFVSELMETSDTEMLTNNTVNTYNYDNLLSQVLQYVVFRNENDTTFILLQIHGGCDVRGGYTDPQVFELTGGQNGYSKLEYYDRFCIEQTEITASDGVNNWDSYNSGYTFEGVETETPDFKEVAIVVEGKVYNKKTGARIMFGNAFIGTAAKGLYCLNTTK